MGQEIFMLGFPSSITSNSIIPLLRNGILSGLDTNTNEIITNSPVYYGDSGGAVFAVDEKSNKLCLIGVISRYIPFTTDWINPREPKAGYTTYAHSVFSVGASIDAAMDLIKSTTTTPTI